jgi:hypothetical protein
MYLTLCYRSIDRVASHASQETPNPAQMSYAQSLCVCVPLIRTHPHCPHARWKRNTSVTRGDWYGWEMVGPAAVLLLAFGGWKLGVSVERNWNKHGFTGAVCSRRVELRQGSPETNTNLSENHKWLLPYPSVSNDLSAIVET